VSLDDIESAGFQLKPPAAMSMIEQIQPHFADFSGGLMRKRFDSSAILLFCWLCCVQARILTAR
jgi:hypothetical protein